MSRRVEFLVQFVVYGFSMKPDIEQPIQRLSSMWQLYSLFHPLKFFDHFASNFSGFNVHWMTFQIGDQLHESRNDFWTVLIETSLFLRPPSDLQRSRQRRGAGVDLIALAVVGFFGGGLAMGSSNSCGRRGSFGGCQDEAKAIAENIWRLSEFQEVLTQLGTDFFTETDQKFFQGKNEMAALNAIQAEVAMTQSRKGIIIQE